MSGANVPYQLRTNKFVERQLFLDLLDHVRLWNGPSKYVYASMGGRFLEDFRLVNERFAIEKMISIEIDEPTWRRQQFNRPYSFIDCRLQSSADFVTDFDRLASDEGDLRFIVWLDYAAANERGRQLQEYRDLISKLGAGDVVKVTLNANHESVRDKNDFKHQIDFKRTVLHEVREQLDEYMPAEGVNPENLNPDSFARLLARAVKNAALKGMDGNHACEIRPLAAFRYRDGFHQMLTLTAIMSDGSLKAAMDADAVFHEWPFRASEWDAVQLIDVPDLSPKERIAINQLLRTDSDFKLHESLPFRLDANEKESLRLFKNYATHYRRYPSFARISY
jgi:hypothetical protein